MRTLYAKLALFAAALSIASTAAAQTWTQVPTPNPGTFRNILRGISGTSPTDVWAVGDYNINVSQLAQDTSRNLIMRWNGSVWQPFTGTELAGNTYMLTDVKAVASNNVYAVGSYVPANVGNANGSYQILHWNGTAWAHQFVSNPPTGSVLRSIDAVSPTDIWAVGRRNVATPLGPELAFAVHYDGSTWTNIPVAPVAARLNEFNSVDAVAANDVWAVGGQTSWPINTFPTSDSGLIMHWNGSSWVDVPSPAIGQGPLLDVKMLSANDGYAVGFVYATFAPYIVHWDGTSWTDVSTGIPPTLCELVPVSSINIHSLGGEIGRRVGSNWSVVNTLSAHPAPNLSSGTGLPNGAIWAAGRTMDAQGNMQTLVYKTDSGGAVNPPTGIAGAVRAAEDVHLTPNPATDVVTLSWDEINQGDMEIIITNAAGRTVFFEKVLRGTKAAMQLDVAKWAIGLYTVNLCTKNGIVARKLVVQQ